MFGSNKYKEELARKDATILELQSELTDYKKSMTSYTNQKMAYEAEKTKLVTKYEGQVTQLKQEIETEKKSVAKRVNAELASIGVSQFVPEEISMEGNNLTKETILDRFTSMPEGPEKHAFFKTNEKIISQALKERNK